MVVSQYFKNVNTRQVNASSLVLVALAHVVILYSLMNINQTLPITKEMLSPMMVSLINPASQGKAVESEFEPIFKTLPSVAKKTTKAEAEMPKLVVEANIKQSAEVSEVRAAVADSARVEKLNSVSEIKNEAEPATPAKDLPVEPPKFGAAYLNNPAPDYPAPSRRFGEQGTVLLRVLVSTGGQAESVQIEISSGYNRLDQAAIKAVKMWSFIPAKSNNQPLSAYVLVPVKFSLAG